MDFLKGYDDFAVLVCPDHPTPLNIKTHSSNPVPYLIYSSKEEKGNGVKSSNGGRCGDLLVRIIVGSLTNLNNEQKKILEHLASSISEDNIQDVKEFNKLKKEYMSRNKGKMK